MLHDLGFINCPGHRFESRAGNPLVTAGDMMKLDDPDNSVDLLYTNCIDHAFDLDQMISEHARVLKPDGYLLYDIGINLRRAAGRSSRFHGIAPKMSSCASSKNFRAVIRIERETAVALGPCPR